MKKRCKNVAMFRFQFSGHLGRFPAFSAVVGVRKELFDSSISKLDDFHSKNNKNWIKPNLEKKDHEHATGKWSNLTPNITEYNSVFFFLFILSGNILMVDIFLVGIQCFFIEGFNETSDENELSW